MEPTPRRAARILLVDDSERLLMFRGFDPTRPEHRYWVTAGGGLDPGETVAEGAARELAEETGLRLPAERFGPPVRHEVVEFPFDGVWYRQEQAFFVVRVPAFEVSTDGFGQLERDTIDGHRWWTLAELESTQERFYPPDLPDLLRTVLRREGQPC
jgi:8-oxo-dGTP pyrophosphatase MutT (NUDIX family)